MCWPLKRGVLQFERIEVSTSFPFGVLRKVLDVQQPDTVLIYPRLYRMNRRLLGRVTQIDMTGRKQMDRGGGTEEFFGLRPYRVGDSVKTIDWKHSARTGTLISREFTQPSPPKVMLLLDVTRDDVGAAGRTEAGTLGAKGSNDSVDPMHASSAPKGAHSGASKRRRRGPGRPDPSDPVERAISLAASLICDAYFYGYQVGMAVRGAKCIAFPMHHSLPHRARMLEALSVLDAASGDGDAEAAPHTEPSVIVHCGASHRESDGRALLLGAANMEKFVREVEGGMTELLSRRMATINRRDELALAAEARESSK